jgi:hypothetical protein
MPLGLFAGATIRRSIIDEESPMASDGYDRNYFRPHYYSVLRGLGPNGRLVFDSIGLKLEHSLCKRPSNGVGQK